MSHDSAYGLWPLVIIDSAIFIIFAFSFTKPRTKRDWRSFSAFSAFIVALFTEMYGFPLTIYLLSGWPEKLHPHTGLMSHNAGHLWSTIFGWQGDPHFSPLHIASNVLIAGGFVLLWAAWRVLYKAQQDQQLATTGVYFRLQHPQYAAFIMIMTGFLPQWPTIPTRVMFPVLVFMYERLAHTEERDAHAAFGHAWDAYAAQVPRWIPRIGSRADDSRFAQ